MNNWDQYQIEKRNIGILADIKTHCILWYGDKIKCNYCDVDDIEKLTIHHKNYFKDSIIHKEFNTIPISNRIKYYSELLEEIMIRPDNFETLCNRCHELLHIHNKNKIPKDEGQTSLKRDED